MVQDYEHNGCVYMTAIDNLDTIHKVEGARLTNSFGTATICCEDIGCISLKTGQIILGNPLEKCSANDFKRKCFAQTVTPGTYSVLLHYAQTETEKYLAFVEIRFSDKRPVSFVTAKTIVDTESKRRGFNGYPVRDSQTGFLDAEEFTQICNLPKMQSPERILEDNDEYMGDDYTLLTNQSQVPCAVSIKIPRGYYYWYWGKDRKGEICCLIGDFFSFL